MLFQVIIVSNDRFREYKILLDWNWRLEPIIKGTSLRLKSCVDNLLKILSMKEQLSISKSLTEDVYSL